MKFGSAVIDGKPVPVVWYDDVTLLDLAWSAIHLKDLNPVVRAAGIEATRITLSDVIAAAKAIRAALGTPRSSLAGGLKAVSDATILAPIPRPAKNVFCVGRNYAEHVSEDNRSRNLETELPKYPQFFTKPPTSVLSPDGVIELDENITRRLDYEVELAVVIGKRGKNIAPTAAYDHVFGYTIVNDISARDLQRRHDQWFKGKALDTTCPMGPWIVEKADIDDPHNLRIELWVNGEQRQSANTSGMIFKIPELIASLSAGLTLEPGDIIATGTPSGVGYAMNPRCFLQSGDVIRCRVEHIGEITNTVQAVPLAEHRS